MTIFKPSKPLTFGIELEIQIIKRRDGLLSPSCPDLLERLPETSKAVFMPEATQSTIEFVSTVHSDAREMHSEAFKHVKCLAETAAEMDLGLRGGGNHAMHFWGDRIAAPTERGNSLQKKYGFLPKRFSTYGLHVHIGMPGANDAIRVGNVLQKLTPMFIALAASSPFHQGKDSGFCASRPLESLVYPFSGGMPVFEDWDDFTSKTSAIYQTGLASSLKDLYWDVRPKPEYGTIEVRSFDMPLQLEKAVALAVLVRRCAGLALEGILKAPLNPLFNLDQCNRFLACRDAMNAELINPFTGTKMTMHYWFKSLLRELRYAEIPDAEKPYIDLLESQLPQHDNAQWMRKLWQETGGDRKQDFQSYCEGLSQVLLQGVPSVQAH